MAILDQNLTQEQSGPDITHMESTPLDSATGTATFTALTNELMDCEYIVFTTNVIQVAVTFDLAMMKYYNLSD